MSIAVQWFIYMATFFNATFLFLPTLVILFPFKSSCLKITTYSEIVHYVVLFFLQEIIKIPESLANERPARSQKKHECNCSVIYCISGNYHLSMLK